MAFLARLDHQIHLESHQGLVTSKTIERDVFVVFLVFAALLVLLVVMLARRLQRRVIAPVHELAEAAREFGEGNLDRRPAVDQDDEIGRLAHAFSSMADAIADQHDELRRKAFHDPLTGLTRQAAGVEQEGVLFIDLDDFKLVNDTRGHAAGDRLLQLVAERLVAAVRESDVVARIGGDEFAVLIAHPVERDTVLTIADRVLEELAQPFDLDGYRVSVGASIGVALRDVQAHDTDLLLRAADAVMYVAKGRGKNRVEVFDPAEHAHLLTGPVSPHR
jgi:diguanylate cyclase (GGDEF)-like protein